VRSLRPIRAGAVAHGLDRIDADRDTKLELLEAADRIPPPLPPRVVAMALDRLHKLGVKVRTSAHVAEILPNGLRLADSTVVPAQFDRVGRRRRLMGPPQICCCYPFAESRALSAGA
jgi:hypothetical protein